MFTISVVDDQDSTEPNGRAYGVEINSTGNGFIFIPAAGHSRAVAMAKAIQRAVNSGTRDKFRTDYENRVLPENR